MMYNNNDDDNNNKNNILEYERKRNTGLVKKTIKIVSEQ